MIAINKSADVFRPATLDDYMQWLRSWLRAGNRPTHFYDYPFERWTWLVAQQDFVTGGECGSNAVSIIVPAGVHQSGEIGHNNLFFMDGPAVRDYGIVPVFADAQFAAIEGMDDFIADERAQSQKFQQKAEAHQRVSDLAAASSDIGQFLGRGSQA
jgi:hypothetical protein